MKAVLKNSFEILPMAIMADLLPNTSPVLQICISELTLVNVCATPHH
jgi:hypothetical protein